MASVSFSVVRGKISSPVDVTEGTAAPGTGDLEVRLDLTKNFNKLELKQALDAIWRFASSPEFSTTIPF